MPAMIDSPSRALAALDEVRRALLETADLGRIKDLRDQARAIRRYAKLAGLGLEIQRRAAEAKLVGERRSGEILLEMQLHGGDRKAGRPDDTRLKDLGIAKEESSRWQQAAALPEQDFQQYLQQANAAGKLPTSSGLLDLARVHAREMGARENLFRKLVHGLQKLARHGSQFGCIHAIPPWPAGRASKANVGCLVQELLDLPVEPVAAKKAHLHLWTPPEMLEDGLRLVRAWGFHYRASLVRAKPAAGSGGYWRPAHDVLLLGVRGDMEFRDRSLLSWMDPHTAEAAESLREIRSVIERASPEPYLELFGNKPTRGWTVLMP